MLETFGALFLMRVDKLSRIFGLIFCLSFSFLFASFSLLFADAGTFVGFGAGASSGSGAGEDPDAGTVTSSSRESEASGSAVSTTGVSLQQQEPIFNFDFHSFLSIGKYQSLCDTVGREQGVWTSD